MRACIGGAEEGVHAVGAPPGRRLGAIGDRRQAGEVRAPAATAWRDPKERTYAASSSARKSSATAQVCSAASAS